MAGGAKDPAATMGDEVSVMNRPSLFALAAVLMCTACASEPEPAPQPQPVKGTAKYYRAFEAAQAAAKDVGVEVRSSDRESGRITGSKDGGEVMIWLQWQPDGSTKIEFTASGAPETSPTLKEKWYSAYQRRMGR
jgi:hypothetical protein